MQRTTTAQVGTTGPTTTDRTVIGRTVASMRLERIRVRGLVLIALALVSLGGCTNDDDPRPSSSEGSPATIPQPVVTGLEVAPESERVDLEMPTFSDPTNVTNPLFPVSRQESVLLLGHVDGLPFRTEVTLLPETRVIEWEGRRVETI